MEKKIKIVADSAVPFLEGVFEPYAEVKYMGGSDIGPDDVRDADALIIRTRTKCDAALLDGSRVKFIATATIGTDHIDFPYCDAHGITVRNAPGCNAGGVMEYVNRDTALLIERENVVEELQKAILYLKAHPEVRKQMSEKAKMESRKYSEAIYFENFVKIIDDIMENNRDEKNRDHYDQ